MFAVMEEYKIKWKSKPVGCLSYPPRVLIKHIKREGGEDWVFGTDPEGVCKQCRKKWKDH